MYTKNRYNTYFVVSITVLSLLVSSNFISNPSTAEWGFEDYYDTWAWSEIELVSTFSELHSLPSSLAVDSSFNVHLVWFDNDDFLTSDGDLDVYYSKKEHPSGKWTLPRQLSDFHANDAEWPEIFVDNSGNLHVVWHSNDDYKGAGTDKDIIYRMYNSTDQVWDDALVVTYDSSNHSEFAQVLVDQQGKAHFIWHELHPYDGSGPDLDIMYRWLDMSGMTPVFSPVTVISEDFNDQSFHPAFQMDTTGKIHIVWHDDSQFVSGINGANIAYRVYDPETNRLSQPWLVSSSGSTSNTFSWFASIEVDSNDHVHIFWEDNHALDSDSTFDIFYREFDPLTGRWTDEIFLSSESLNIANRVSTSVDLHDNIFVAWVDESEIAENDNDRDIFMKVKMDGTWDDGTIIPVDTPLNSYDPFIFVDRANQVHLTLGDNSQIDNDDIFGDIYYQKLSGKPKTPQLILSTPKKSEDGIVGLSWDETFGATEYIILRNTEPTFDEPDELTPQTSTTHVDIVTSDGFYYYGVKAVNINGNSTISNVIYVDVKLENSVTECQNCNSTGTNTTVTETITQETSDTHMSESETSGTPLSLNTILWTLVICLLVSKKKTILY